MIFLASTPMRPVDLSSKSGFTFFAKGDVEIQLMAFAASAGRIPRMTTVHAGPDWTEISVKWSDFGFDGKDVQAILFGGPDSGTADFWIQAADSDLLQQRRGVVLEDARAHPLLAVRPAPRLDDDRLDSLQPQQMGENQSGRSGADYSDLRSHRGRAE